MAKNTPNQKMKDMNIRHTEIIEEMILTQKDKTDGFINNGIKIRSGRVAHQFRIDGIPYWVIMAG